MTFFNLEELNIITGKDHWSCSILTALSGQGVVYCLRKHWLNKPQCSSVCYLLCLPNTSKRRTDVVPAYLGHIESGTFHNACFMDTLLNQYLIFKRYYIFGNQHPHTPVQIVVYSFFFLSHPPEIKIFSTIPGTEH